MPFNRATVCIIGAGAAGLTLAHALAPRCGHVILLEGGGPRPADELEDTYSTLSVGIPHRGAHEGRVRAWGGSTTRWGGQLWPWERYEFEPRPELEIDGWPIPFEAVASYYADALKLLGVREPGFSTSRIGAKRLAQAAFDPDVFLTKYSVWLPWRRRNLGRTIGQTLQASSNVQRTLNTTAKQIVMNADGSRALGVRVRSVDGNERTIEADVVVLAAGAIESTRLLMSSRQAGLGCNDWLGRGFMDHLSVRVARFRPRNARAFANLFAPVFVRGLQYTPRIVATSDRQIRDRILGAFGHWEWVLPPHAGLIVLRTFLRSIQSGQLPELRGVGWRGLVRGARDSVALAATFLASGRRFIPEDTQIFLRVDSEQKPDRESRLYLSQEQDEFGLPRVIIDWRVSDLERWTVRRVADLLKGELTRLGLGELDLLTDPFDDSIPWGAERGDSFHMMGGSRMARAPDEGVVDTNLRVFGIDNLFVASTSVFPTGGMANPTLTLLALTLRLADYLSHHSGGSWNRQ